MSERLTKRKDYGCACWNGDQNLVTHRRYSEMLEALAKYEDVIFDASGNEVISLARLRELAEAEREGKIRIGSGWTPCAEGENLPQSEKQVLLTCVSDNKRIYECKGYHLTKHSKEIGCADDLESDYDEETDRNYCPEGFYECIENWGDYSFVYINDTVLAWQPLPAPYTPDHIGDNSHKRDIMPV